MVIPGIGATPLLMGRKKVVPFEIAHTASSVMSGSGNSRYNNSLSLGGADPDRWILICIQWMGFTGNPPNVFLNGVPATHLIGNEDPATGGGAIYKVAFPTGAIGSVACAFNYDPGSTTVSAYRAVGSSLATATSARFNNGAFSRIISYAQTRPALSAVLVTGVAAQNFSEITGFTVNGGGVGNRFFSGIHGDGALPAGGTDIYAATESNAASLVNSVALSL